MALTDLSFAALILSYCLSANGLQPTTITNLRQFDSQIAVARFTAPVGVLAEEIRRIKQQDVACGNEVKLDLHVRTPNVTDSSSSTSAGQLFISLGTIEDYTLKKELSCEIKNEIAVTHRYFLVGIPFTSGPKQGVLLKTVLSDSPKRVLSPYVTNYQMLQQIDRIEEGSDGTVFLYKDDDVMELNIQYDKECQRVESSLLRNDFLQLTSNSHLSTSYPLPFDWGCDRLGLNTSFCRKLEEYQCDLGRAGSDICGTKIMTRYQPCHATFSIVNMTGFFQNEFLPVVPELPMVSFEAEWVNSTQSAGLVFPCFTE